MPVNHIHHHNKAEFNHNDNHHAPAAPTGHPNKVANTKDPAAIADYSFAVHQPIFFIKFPTLETQFFCLIVET